MDDILNNLTPEQVEALSAQISPETAAALQQRLQPVSPVQPVQMSPVEQLSAESQMYQAPMTQIPTTRQEDERAAFFQQNRVLNPQLQQDVQDATRQGISVPQLQQNQEQQAQMQQQLQQEMARKDEEQRQRELMAAADAEAKELERLQAEKAAMQVRQREMYKVQAQQANVDQRRLQLEEKANKELDEDEESPFKGNKFLLALAVGLGGYAGALTGQENPALKILNARMQEIQNNKKLKQDEKLAKQKAELDRAELEIKNRLANIQDKEANANIAKIMTEIDAKRAEITEKLNFNLSGPSKNITADELNSISDPKMAERYVGVSITNPDGTVEKRFFPSSNKEVAQKMNMETVPALENALSAFDELKTLNKNAPMYSKLSPNFLTEAGRAGEAISQRLIGQLRLELFGPGVLTQQEQEKALKIVGSPTSFYSAVDQEANERLLDRMKEAIRVGLRNRYRQAGVALPESVDEVNVRNAKKILKSRGKEGTVTEAIELLKANGQWRGDDAEPEE